MKDTLKKHIFVSAYYVVYGGGGGRKVGAEAGPDISKQFTVVSKLFTAKLRILGIAPHYFKCPS